MIINLELSYFNKQSFSKLIEDRGIPYKDFKHLALCNEYEYLNINELKRLTILSKIPKGTLKRYLQRQRVLNTANVLINKGETRVSCVYFRHMKDDDFNFIIHNLAVSQ